MNTTARTRDGLPSDWREYRKAVAARLDAANLILAAFAPGCRLEYARGLYFAWTDFRGDAQRLRWAPRSRGSDFPGISYRLPFGGTCTVATMELTRWVRGVPCRPLAMWERCHALGMTRLALERATAAGWPVTVPCVMCGRQLGNGVGYDHYDHDGIPAPGPGCWGGEGCQSPKPAGGSG